MFKFVSHLILPAAVTGMIAVGLTTPSTYPVTPTGCRLTATWSVVWIYKRVCDPPGAPAPAPAPPPPADAPNPAPDEPAP